MVRRLAGGLAGARVVRASSPSPRPVNLAPGGEAELQFFFVLTGSCALEVDEASHGLGAGDAAVLPVDRTTVLSAASSELEILEVTLPE